MGKGGAIRARSKGGREEDDGTSERGAKMQSGRS